MPTYFNRAFDFPQGRKAEEELSQEIEIIVSHCIKSNSINVFLLVYTGEQHG